MEYPIQILIIDAQGGGVGRQLVSAVRQALPDAAVTAVGTNSAATSAMLKAGPHRAATGENAVVVACRTADIVVGPRGIVGADAMLGEVTPAMAAAVSGSEAVKILIPSSTCGVHVAGTEDCRLDEYLRRAVEIALRELEK